MRFARALAVLVLAAPLAAAAADADVEVRTDVLQLRFASAGGQPESWQACEPDCAAPRSSLTFGAAGAPPVRLVAADDPGLTRRLGALAFRSERREEASAIRVDLLSEPLADGVRLRETWRIPRRGYEVALELALEGDGAGAFERAHPLSIEIAPGSGESGVALAGWNGSRSRFWTLLAKPAASPGSLSYRLYAGPIEPRELRSADPALTGLLFTHLWSWIRPLSFGLLWLLGHLLALVGNPGFAILLLAVCVKILMRPLTALAERWQREVNLTRSQLQPEIDAIKAASQGSERSQRLLELHRARGVSPFFGLKSLLAVAIQIPVFFAAYHALDEAFVLDGVRLLWIANLTEPDRLASLPFRLFYLGDGFNLLPFAMSAVTILSSRLHDDGSLAPQLLRRQRLSLYGMALAFFLLFYPFPAGMVLYWTSNNLVALLWGAISRRLPLRRERSGGLALGTLRR